MNINIYIQEYWFDDGRGFDRLEYLQVLIHSDILRRILHLSDIECEISVVVLQKDKGQTSKTEIFRDICKTYHLLSVPRVLDIVQGEGAGWPGADIVYMKKIRGEYPSTDSPPDWMCLAKDWRGAVYSKKIRDIQTINITERDNLTERDKKYFTAPQLIHRNWSPEDIRTLLTFGGTLTYTPLDDAAKLVKKINNQRQLTVNKKIPGSKSGRSGPKQSLEVLLGGFHNAMANCFNSPKIAVNSAAFRMLEIINTNIAAISECDPEAMNNYKEIDQFYDICLFLLFPQDFVNMGLETCTRPAKRDDLISLWEHERLVSIPVQVDGKIRGRVTLTADASVKKNKVLKLACDLPQVNKALDNRPPARIEYVEGRILALQSIKAQLKRMQKDEPEGMR